MQELFSFQLPNPLPEDGWKVLRSRLAMKSYGGAAPFRGVGHIQHGIQAYLIQDGEDNYLLAVRSVYPLAAERVIYHKSKGEPLPSGGG